jgi:hypothetical protein
VFKYSPYYNERLIPRVFSLEKAGMILDGADWIDRDGDGVREKYVGADKFTLDFTLLIYADSAEWRTVATVLRDDLKKIGCRMEILPVDWASLQKRMDAHDFDAYTGGWGLGWDPDPYQVWHSSQADALGGSNKIGFRDKECDRIIEELRVTFDPAGRKRLLHFQVLRATAFFFTRVWPLWWGHLKSISFRNCRRTTCRCRGTSFRTEAAWAVARGHAGGGRSPLAHVERSPAPANSLFPHEDLPHVAARQAGDRGPGDSERMTRVKPSLEDSGGRRRSRRRRSQ